MAAKSKALSILLILGFTSFGVFSYWETFQEVVGAFNFKKIFAAKKISPVKPDLSRIRIAREDAFKNRIDYSFFETLNDPLMTKYVDLEGSVLGNDPADIEPVVSQVKFEGPESSLKSVEPISLATWPLKERSSLKSPARFSESKLDSSGLVKPFAVQVSSFRELRRAKVLKLAFEQKGYTVFLKAADIPGKGGVWHRVYIGPFSDKKTADGVVSRVRQEEGLNAMVIRQAG